MVESRKANDQKLTKNDYVPFEDLSQDKLKNLISTLSEIRKKKYKRGAIMEIDKEKLKKFLNLIKDKTNITAQDVN